MTARAKRSKRDKRLTALRREWKEWSTGRALADWRWSGVPWCSHSRAPAPDCEGCATRAYARYQMRRIEAEAAALERPTGPLVEGELLALVGGEWVTA
jgi:hypothetical protein